MSDIFNLSDLTTVDVAGVGPGAGPNKDTGDLRRKFNFGDRVSELSIAQDPFFRFVSKASKKPTDDPEFKWTEKRNSWHKRYAYVVGVSGDDATYQTNGTFTSSGSFDPSGENVVYMTMSGDWKSSGNGQNVFGNTSTGAEIKVGDNGTLPKHFIPGQIIKVPASDGAPLADGFSLATDYFLVKVDNVTELPGQGNFSNSVIDNANQADLVKIQGKVVKTTAKTALTVNDSAGASVAGTSIAGEGKAAGLEDGRCYVVGSAFLEGSGYPETWKDQPYSTNHGLTQIWKTSMAMSNTARATVLKYDSNEWARVWKEKLVEHKWDIEQSILFGSQGSVDSVNYTQGAIDYILQYGNQFTLDIDTQTADGFLDDLSNFLDPRYNPSMGAVFFVNTSVYNWMHKLGGYFRNNLELSPNYRADFAATGKKKVLGVDITTFSTPYGDMNVARNIHLDGTNVQMACINMKYAKYRPLVGNGVNRDTSVYVGVQTIENSGIDRRVDLILTEAGMEFSMPECHAVWTA